MQRNLTSWRPATAVLIALVASVAITACGGSSSAGSGGSTDTNGASANASGLKFASCVRAHGVPDFPDPGTSGGQQIKVTPSKMTVDGHTLSESSRVVQTAMQKCQKYSPVAKGPPISAAQLAKIKAGALAMAKCMRSHGVPNFPDPQVGTGPGGHGVSVGIRAGGPKGSGGPGFSPNSPAFKAAMKTCQPLMSKVLPGLAGKKG